MIVVKSVGKISTFYITEKSKSNKKTSIRKRSYSIIFRAIRLIKKIKFSIYHDRKSLCVITWNIVSSKNIKEFAIPHWILFTRCVILSITTQIICVWEHLNWIILFISQLQLWPKKNDSLQTSLCWCWCFSQKKNK